MGRLLASLTKHLATMSRIFCSIAQNLGKRQFLNQKSAYLACAFEPWAARKPLRPTHYIIAAQIQQQGLSISNQLRLIDDIKNNADFPAWAKERFQKIIDKNEGLKQLKTKLESPGDIDFANKVEYLPLVSADVERSVSQYKYILNDRRTALSEENVEIMNIVMFNCSSQKREAASCTVTSSTSQQMVSSVEEIIIDDFESD